MLANTELDADTTHAGSPSLRTLGMASGAFADIDEAVAVRGGITLVRGLRPSAEDLRTALSEALQLAASGRLRAVIEQTFPLADAAGAHGAIERRETIGKTLLRVNPLD